jgi:heat shock protein HslJ
MTKTQERSITMKTVWSPKQAARAAGLLIAMLALSACGILPATPTPLPPPPPTPAPTPTPPAELDATALKNATYTGIYPDQEVGLTDGEYEGEPFVEGGASRPTVIFIEPHAFGDLNGDGLDDAAVLLVENSGGSGSFVYLAAVVNEDGQPVNVATELLGDRARVQSLSIVDGVLTVDMVTHAPNDPMCCPSLKVLDTYELQGNAWTRLSHEADVPALTADDVLNATYTNEWPKEGVAPLVDGVYEEEIMPDSASKIVVMVVPDQYAFGDLNGDGVDDAVAILASSGGGSGTFISLEALLNEGGVAQHLATAQLGDRTQVQSVAIVDASIVIEMVTHAPNDPMCCPSLSVADTYELQGENLVQVSRVEPEPTTPETPPTDAGLLGPIWLWQGYDGADEDIVVPYPPSYRIEFSSDGNVAIKADCNRALGSYTAEATAVTLTLGPVTLAECAPPSWYDRYLALLEQVASFERDGDILYLDLADDGGRMTFGKYHAVTGKITAPADATMPQGATVEVKVVDAGGTQVGGVLYAQPPQFPLSFEAHYHAPAIDPEQSYELHVTVKDADGNAVFATPQPIPVLTQGNWAYHLKVGVETVSG